MNKVTLKVIGYTHWGNNKYPRITLCDLYDESDIVDAAVSDLKKNNYHWDGLYHQNGTAGVPVINIGSGASFMCSCRRWGEIMACAYPEEIDNEDGLGYCAWAWGPYSEDSIKTPLIENVLL